MTDYAQYVLHDAQFVSASTKNTKHARHFVFTLQVFVLQAKLSLARGLKILVSVVRFRPRPPYQHRSFATTVFSFVRRLKNNHADLTLRLRCASFCCE